MVWWFKKPGYNRGSSIIYSFRPEGCRVYPLVYDENNRKVFVHDLCPYGHEFKVSGGDIETLHAFFKKLSKKAVIISTALVLF
jgi:Fe-S-cluster containining protein